MFQAQKAKTNINSICERFLKDICVINREYINCLIPPILEIFSKWRFQPGMKITTFETMEKGTANSSNSGSSKNCFHFYHFLEPQWQCFRLKKIFWASNGIGFVFKTSLSSHSFATKQPRVSQVTPIFLSRCIKSKNAIFTFSEQSTTIWKLAHMLNFGELFDFKRF